MDVMQLISGLVWLLAGVGVFIVGMNFLSGALERSAGGGMKKMLGKITGNLAKLAAAELCALANRAKQADEARGVIAAQRREQLAQAIAIVGVVDHAKRAVWQGNALTASANGQLFKGCNRHCKGNLKNTVCHCGSLQRVVNVVFSQKAQAAFKLLVFRDETEKREQSRIVAQGAHILGKVISRLCAGNR